MKFSNNIIVVNDGSTDGTSEKLNSLKDKITVISYSKNRGKGYALRTGFKYAIETGFHYAITIDADGQHFADDIPAFVETIVHNYGALIVGDRELDGVNINAKSSFANRFSNFWFTLYTGRKLKDTQTGYRAYPLDSFSKWSRFSTNRYESELEYLILASWRGIDIINIPIKVYYPPASERVSHFRPGMDFFRISVANTVFFPLAILIGFPMRLWNHITQRRFFNKEFTLFTRKDGRQKEASITLSRLARSIFGLLFFLFYTVVVFTPFSSLYFLIGKDSSKKRFRFHKMLKRMSRYITIRFPGAKVEFENPYEETFATPAIVICNHQSHLDLPMILSASERFICLTNDRVWKNKFYGKIIRFAEFAPISTEMDELASKLKGLVSRGYSIVIFPEGTRSADCSIARFHQGAFYLAKTLNIDIVPMVLHGAGHYLPKNDFMFRKGSISLKILKRVAISEINHDEPLRMTASFFRKIIKSGYADLEFRKEKSEYFRSLISYKYAWRGWKIVSESKNELRRLKPYFHVIDNVPTNVKKVRVINSGIGTFAILYALVNPHIEVYAFEADERRFNIAESTAALPPNLHYHSPAKIEDYYECGVVDMNYVLKAKRLPDLDFSDLNPIFTIYLDKRNRSN